LHFVGGQAAMNQARMPDEHVTFLAQEFGNGLPISGELQKISWNNLPSGVRQFSVAATPWN